MHLPVYVEVAIDAVVNLATMVLTYTSPTVLTIGATSIAGGFGALILL